MCVFVCLFVLLVYLRLRGCVYASACPHDHTVYGQVDGVYICACESVFDAYVRVCVCECGRMLCIRI